MLCYSIYTCLKGDIGRTERKKKEDLLLFTLEGTLLLQGSARAKFDRAKVVSSTRSPGPPATLR